MSDPDVVAVWQRHADQWGVRVVGGRGTLKTKLTVLFAGTREQLRPMTIGNMQAWRILIDEAEESDGEVFIRASFYGGSGDVHSRTKAQVDRLLSDWARAS